MGSAKRVCFDQVLQASRHFSGLTKPQAMIRARSTSAHRDSGRWQMTLPMRSRCASEMWSKFSAHVTGIPSSVVRTTSVLRPRIVRVTGATMISFRRSITSLRVRIRIGRRLSGTRKVYQRISPGFHATVSQPSASQARESSSLENSDAVDGCAR